MSCTISSTAYRTRIINNLGTVVLEFHDLITFKKLSWHSKAVFAPQALLNKGAKYIIVQGLPPTGCLTLSMSLAPTDDRDDMGCVGSLNKQSYLHNTIFQAKLNDLRKKFPQAVIVYADFWNAYANIVKSAKNYRFRELFKVCCGSGGGTYNFDASSTCGSPASTACTNPSQYINWDGVHLTEAMYKVLAHSFLNGTFCHPTFGYLLEKKLQSGWLWILRRMAQIMASVTNSIILWCFMRLLCLE